MTLRELTRAIVPTEDLTVKLENIYEDEICTLEDTGDCWRIPADALMIVTMASTVIEINVGDNLLRIMVH